MSGRVAGAFLLILLVAGPVLSQVNGETDNAKTEAEELVIPPWLLDLRRAEIIVAGSFPLTLLASRMVYSLVRFTIRSIQAGGIDVNYAPWFLAPPGAPVLEAAEKLGIVAGAVSLSGIIAFIDYRRGQAEGDDAGE